MEEFGFQLAFGGIDLHAVASWDIAADRERAYVLFLHGGGAGTTSEGTRYLRDDLAQQGVASVAFDFSGHGRSAGCIADATLRQRQEEVRRVVDSLRPARPRAIVATSMAGHTACRVLDAVRPDALVLVCPAAYEARAETACFGEAFRAVIRSTRAFGGSPAFDALGRFEGRVLIFYGSQDAVIPRAVQEGYARAAARARSVECVEFPGAGHRLHDWLAGSATARRDMVARLVSVLS